MGFFNKIKQILSRKTGKESDPDKLPAEIELIPNELWVEVAVHSIPQTINSSNNSALSFLTRGMIRHKQAELFFVLKTNKTGIDDVPEEPLLFFQQVYSLASKGQLAQEGSITQFGKKDLWGWKGIVYAKSPPHLERKLPKKCLSMVLLSLDEVQAVQQYGHTRILSMLGKQSRYFPFPYWTDHYRDNLLIREVDNKSVLSKIRRVSLPEASAILVNNEHLSLKMQLELNLNLQNETFPSDIPVAILCSLSRDADSCLTWSFDSTSPEAITLPNSKGKLLSGCFLLIAGEQEKDSVRILEDGFAVMLTKANWDLLWESFKNRNSFDLKSGSGSPNFSLVWY